MATVALTTDQFRTDYPEFMDKSMYPDSMLTYWLGVANLMLHPSRWNDSLNLGLELFMAHNIVLEKQAADTAGTGGWPGLNKGVISSESPGSVSVSYDTSAALEEKAGHWNFTVYGLRFIRLAKMMGAGPVQVGLPCSSSLDPWFGPDTTPNLNG